MRFRESYLFVRFCCDTYDSDAASGYILDELENGNSAPSPSDVSKVKADEYENGIVSVIMLDIDSYAEKYGSKRKS